jgi:hypothetical protein
VVMFVPVGAFSPAPVATANDWPYRNKNAK